MLLSHPVQVEGQHGAGHSVGVGQAQHMAELMDHHLQSKLHEVIKQEMVMKEFWGHRLCWTKKGGHTDGLTDILTQGQGTRVLVLKI